MTAYTCWRRIAEQVRPPEGLLVQRYGGGVNTIACLILMARAGLRPTAIVMADPGSERRGTVHYRDVVLPPWLAAHGFPSVTVVSRKTEGPHAPRSKQYDETLLEECLRTATIPSIAYGPKKCSAKYKGDPQRWWIARQPWALAEWSAGRKLVAAVGYDIDEAFRVDKARDALAPPADPEARDYGKWERERFVPWHPLVEARMGREECEELIAAEGLPIPPKSACVYCPSNSLEEWRELQHTDPEAFEQAVEMSRRAEATITAPDVVGLMRCSPPGRRQLHVWAEGSYVDEPTRQLDLFMPCESECGT